MSLINKTDMGDPRANMAGMGVFNVSQSKPSWVIYSGANQHYITNVKILTNAVNISNLNKFIC